MNTAACAASPSSPGPPSSTGSLKARSSAAKKYPELNQKPSEIAQRYDVTPTGMAIAWILRHPAQMQPIIGSVRPERMREIVQASDITITHDEWYELYKASGKNLP